MLDLTYVSYVEKILAALAGPGPVLVLPVPVAVLPVCTGPVPSPNHKRRGGWKTLDVYEGDTILLSVFANHDVLR